MIDLNLSPLITDELNRLQENKEKLKKEYKELTKKIKKEKDKTLIRGMKEEQSIINEKLNKSEDPNSFEFFKGKTPKQLAAQFIEQNINKQWVLTDLFILLNFIYNFFYIKNENIKYTLLKRDQTFSYFKEHASQRIYIYPYDLTTDSRISNDFCTNFEVALLESLMDFYSDVFADKPDKTTESRRTIWEKNNISDALFNPKIASEIAKKLECYEKEIKLHYYNYHYSFTEAFELVKGNLLSALLFYKAPRPIEVKNKEIKETIEYAEIDNFMFINPTEKMLPNGKYKDKHEKYTQVLGITKCNLPCYLYGETGTGKTYLVGQVAEELKLDFHFSNSPQDAFALLGFIDAGGKYQSTPYRKAYEQGGVFFLDELDNCPAEVLVCINSHLSGDFADFPDKQVKKHKDFRFLAGGNTKGRQDDFRYSARSRIDESTLNRFIIVEVDYDTKLEKQLCHNNKEFLEFMGKMREAYKQSAIKISTRTFVYGYNLYSSGIKDLKQLEKCLTGELTLFESQTGGLSG